MMFYLFLISTRSCTQADQGFWQSAIAARPSAAYKYEPMQRSAELLICSALVTLHSILTMAVCQA